MRNIVLIILVSLSVSANGQPPFEEDIETDSSNIEIIRNSVYRVYTETFKKSDSVWYNVTYIDDSTQLNTEGWKLKNDRLLGTWKEYNRKGQLMYTWDHDKHTCVVNPKLFPYSGTLEKMKQVADKMIIDAYGKEFMDNHVVFDFDCYAYHKYKGKFDCCKDSMWTDDYLGSWTEPIKSKPNSFLLRYEVRLNPTDEKFIELGICLDDKGNYVPSEDDVWNNYGFELIKPGNKKFILNKSNAITLARSYGLTETDSGKINEFLFWENFRKQEFYNGQFRYYITQLVDKIDYKKSEDRQGIIYKYVVFVFNPWTGEFVEKKKMKSIREWGKMSGHSTGLLPDDD